MEPPLDVGDGLDEMRLGNAGGLPFGEEAVAVREVRLHILVRHDDHLSGQAVPDGVEAGTFFAFGSARSSAVARVGAVRFNLKS